MGKARAFVLWACLMVVLFHLIDARAIVGRMVNVFLRCKQDPMTSFPCYGLYDIFAMFLCAGVFLFCMIRLFLISFSLIKERFRQSDLKS